MNVMVFCGGCVVVIYVGSNFNDFGDIGYMVLKVIGFNGNLMQEIVFSFRGDQDMFVIMEMEDGCFVVVWMDMMFGNGVIKNVIVDLCLIGVKVNGIKGKDFYVGLEYIDILFGLVGDDRFQGGVSDDELEGGDGNDILEGGVDFDFVFYCNVMKFVVVSFVIFGVNMNDVKGDIYVSIEGLIGFNDINDIVNGGGDILIGNDQVNKFWGLVGNDKFYGGVDNDMLMGGVGSDNFYGGVGVDSLNGGEDGNGVNGWDVVSYVFVVGVIFFDCFVMNVNGFVNDGEVKGDQFIDI